MIRSATATACLALGLLAGCGGGGESDQPGSRPGLGPVHPSRNSEAHKGTDWSYQPPTGPQRWASLDPDYAECAAGTRQSPVDLRPSVKRELPPVTLAYRDSPVHLENNGHSVEAAYEEGHTVHYAGQSYELIQSHFHSPSEHTVGGRHRPVELHFVHEAESGEHLVVGVFAVPGQTNTSWLPITDVLPAAEGETALVDGEINPLSLLPRATDTAQRWAYTGSLTTPPCTEGVHWLVLRRPIEMSNDQIAAFAAAYSGNHRPVQKHGDRTVGRNF